MAKMSKTEYLIRRYAGEYNKLHYASYWGVEICKYKNAFAYFYERLRRKEGIVLLDLLDIKLAIERSKSISIQSGSEVDCEIKKLVAMIRLRKKA